LEWRLRTNKLASVPRWTASGPVNIWALIVCHGLSPCLRKIPRCGHDNEPNDLEPDFGEEWLPMRRPPTRMTLFVSRDRDVERRHPGVN
jgi:hypothetical protein